MKKYFQRFPDQIRLISWKRVLETNPGHNDIELHRWCVDFCWYFGKISQKKIQMFLEGKLQKFPEEFLGILVLKKTIRKFLLDEEFFKTFQVNFRQNYVGKRVSFRTVENFLFSILHGIFSQQYVEILDELQEHISGSIKKVFFSLFEGIFGEIHDLQRSNENFPKLLLTLLICRRCFENYL